jgi:hypothetical protein
MPGVQAVRAEVRVGPVASAGTVPVVGLSAGLAAVPTLGRPAASAGFAMRQQQCSRAAVRAGAVT